MRCWRCASLTTGMGMGSIGQEILDLLERSLLVHGHMHSIGMSSIGMGCIGNLKRCQMLAGKLSGINLPYR